MISDQFWASLPATLASIATLIIAWRTGAKVEEVRHATNSLTDRLVSTTEKESLARGIAQGIASAKSASFPPDTTNTP